MQNKKQSLVEAITNTFVGFLITLVFAPIINWICGIQANPRQVTLSVILFTILSIIRGYFIRRYYNNKLLKQIKSGKDLYQKFEEVKTEIT